MTERYLLLYDEVEYHRHFIQSPERFPSDLQTSGSGSVFTWAYEFNTENTREGGRLRRADLLTVDETGRLWLIEAKLATNPELSGSVWRNQLIPYRDELAKLSWQSIEGHTRRFLGGRGKHRPHIQDRAGAFPSLQAALSEWMATCEPRTQIPVGVMMARMAEQIRSKSIGLAVLANLEVDDVIDGAASVVHEGPLAYIVGIPLVHEPGAPRKMEMQTVWRRDSGSTSIPVLTPIQSVPYAEYDRAIRSRYACRSLDRFLQELNPAARDVCSNLVLPEFRRLGWDGTVKVNSNARGMKLSFDVGQVRIPCIQLGFPDSVGTAIKQRYQIPGSYSFKIQIYLRLFGCKGPDGLPYGGLPGSLRDKWLTRFTRVGWALKSSSSPGHEPSWLLEYRPTFGGEPSDAEVLGGFIPVFEDYLEALREHMSTAVEPPTPTDSAPTRQP